MNRKLAGFCVLAFLLLATTSCQKLQARDNLTKGIKAFKEGKYDRAAEYFDTASKQDPDLTNAQLYLATAYAQQFIPDVPSEENQQFARNAIATFEKVLEKDPKNTNAIGGLAGLYQGLKELNKSREYYKKQTEIEPDNAVPFYAVASTDWYMLRDRTHPVTEEEKAQIVEEGMQYVDKALEKNPQYQEAMAYKNLLLRDKAAITKDPAESKRLLDEANVWFDKALAQLKANSEKKATEVPAAQ
jgi:tetratricopeptide (TPR) repeat protein